MCWLPIFDQAEATGNEAALARLTEVQETLQELARNRCLGDSHD